MIPALSTGPLTLWLVERFRMLQEQGLSGRVATGYLGE
jgi:hypothetical protein